MALSQYIHKTYIYHYYKKKNIYLYISEYQLHKNGNNNLYNFDEEKFYSRVNDFEGMVSKL